MWVRINKWSCINIQNQSKATKITSKWKWSSQLWSNLSSYKQTPEKILRLQRDSNPWAPRYRCDAIWSLSYNLHIFILVGCGVLVCVSTLTLTCGSHLLLLFFMCIVVLKFHVHLMFLSNIVSDHKTDLTCRLSSDTNCCCALILLSGVFVLIIAA